MPLVSIQAVSASLGHRSILHSIDLTIDHGQRVAVLGPSGAGKSTLLRLLAGLIRPSSGSVAWEGQPCNRQSLLAGCVALVSQDYALYPHLTVLQNLQVSLRQRRLSVSEIEGHCLRAAQHFQINGLLDRHPSQLSGGQAQRVALAKAVALRPALLLLDEPLSQLDRLLHQELIECLLAASTELDMALCWVAHDPVEAFQAGTQVVVLDQGRIVQSALPEQLYRHPINRLAASLGSRWPVNWLPIGEGPNRIVADSLYLSPSLLNELDEVVSVGIRAEHFHLANPASDAVILRGKVALQTFLGFARLIEVQVGQTTVHWLDTQGQYHPGMMDVELGVSRLDLLLCGHS